MIKKKMKRQREFCEKDCCKKVKTQYEDVEWELMSVYSTLNEDDSNGYPKCDKCQNFFDRDCQKAYYCDNPNCYSVECNMFWCKGEDILLGCSSCGDKFCKDCSIICKDCENRYCKECAIKHTD